MSNWTHAICVDCWNERYPESPAVEPVEVFEDTQCCFCGGDTASGIYVNHDPSELNCQGVTGEHA